MALLGEELFILLPHNSDWVVGRFLISVSPHPDLVGTGNPYAALFSAMESSLRVRRSSERFCLAPCVIRSVPEQLGNFDHSDE